MRLGWLELFTYRKDGGPESTVWGYFLVAIKPLFSIVLLRFEPGSRDAYHSHAFNCWSWVLRGLLQERHIDGRVQWHGPSACPFPTYRETTHKVVSHGRTWVLSIRGPWARTWREVLPNGVRVLTWGRKQVA